MPIFLREDSKELRNKTVEIPKELVQKAKEVAATVGEDFPKAKGTKRIKKIANIDDGKTYNKKKGEDEIVKSNGKEYMKIGAIKRAVHDLKGVTNPKSVTLAANGGTEFKRFYNDALNRARTAVKEPEIVKQVKPNNANVSKIVQKPMKPIDINGNKITVECRKSVRLNESQLKTLRKMKQ